VQLVKEIMRLLQTEGALVKKEYDWPLFLTPAHFQTWFLEILEDIYEFDNVAFGLLGKSDTGKSPAGRTVLMAQCRNNMKKFETPAFKPCLRVTTEFDLLRGERGNEVMGDFLDDGSVFMIAIKALLQFTDVGLFEAVTWARWGCTKWVQKQPRGFADNAHFVSSTLHEFRQLTHKEFMQIIQPSIHKEATEAHEEALLKRTAYLVITKDWVAWRRAGSDPVTVNRRFIDEPKFLTDEGKTLYGKYRDGCRELPANHAELAKDEQLWVDAVLLKNQKRREEKHASVKILGPPLFQPKVGLTPTAKIKKELVERAFKKLKTNPVAQTIDLDSSPEKLPEASADDLARAVHESRVTAGMSASSTAIPVRPYVDAFDNPHAFGPEDEEEDEEVEEDA
jgi:hypothetical protein